MIPASRQRNLLQSALYMAIAGVLAAVLLERLLTYAEAAEKAAMEATLSRLHAALYVRVAYLVLRGQTDALEALPAQSPFAAVELNAVNYLGEFEGVPGGNAADGKWIFDRPRRELVYVPSLKRYLLPGDGERPADGLRFRVEVRKASNDAYTGVVIRPVGGARWDPLP